MRHRQTKGSVTDRPHLNYRVTPRLVTAHRSDSIFGCSVGASAFACNEGFRKSDVVQTNPLEGLAVS